MAVRWLTDDMRLSALGALALCLTILLGLDPSASGAGAPSDFPFRPTDFTVYSADGKKVIGRSHYDFQEHEGLIDVRGEATFLNGEHDEELSTIELDPEGGLPTLAWFSHSYYGTDGKLFLSSYADIKARLGTCTRYAGGKETTQRALLEFSRDTFAGAGLVIPVDYALRHGVDRLKFHAFSCVPDPRVLAVEARVKSRGERWSAYRGELVRVDIVPDFGWLNLLAAPFVPKYRAWFDPADNWQYVGGRNDRYYRGPTVQLVRFTPPAVTPREVLSAPPGATLRPSGADTPDDN